MFPTNLALLNWQGWRLHVQFSFPACYDDPPQHSHTDAPAQANSCDEILVPTSKIPFGLRPLVLGSWNSCHILGENVQKKSAKVFVSLEFKEKHQNLTLQLSQTPNKRDQLCPPVSRKSKCSPGTRVTDHPTNIQRQIHPSCFSLKQTKHRHWPLVRW